MINYEKNIFELSTPGRVGYRLPDLDVEKSDIDEKYLNKDELNLPEVSEPDVVRHYTQLSLKNYSLDGGFYPLGSCTMKYNPKLNEEMAALSGFRNIHPLQNEESVQGALQMMYELAQSLSEIAGMDETTLQPAAGAHGELTGITLIKAYHEDRGDFKRTKIIVPDSAHGTNPATVAFAGLEVVEVKSNPDGRVCVEDLKKVLSDEIAGLMLTNPNTLGIFETEITEIARLVHEAGGLLYYDGANANAILGHSRAGDMGFDVIHFNVHKTFSTPHGGGGPGGGPVGVKDILRPYLPVPVVTKTDSAYKLDYDRPKSIGKMKGFYGHFAVMVRAYSYILSMGSDGLRRAADLAVLNSNYLANKLKGAYELPVGKLFKHEFVLSTLKEANGVITLDVAKRLQDYGFHPPTVYFPLIIHEAIMIEPTETESLDTLKAFADTMLKIAEEAKTDPDLVKGAPHNTLVKRPDEVKAARTPILTAAE